MRYLLPILLAAGCSQEAATARLLTGDGGRWVAESCSFRDTAFGPGVPDVVVDERDCSGQVELTFSQEETNSSAAYFSSWRTGEIVAPDGWVTNFDWDATETSAGEPQLWLFLYEDALLRQGEWYAQIVTAEKGRVDLSIDAPVGYHRYEVELGLSRP